MSAESNIGAEKAIVATILSQAETQARQALEAAQSLAAQETERAEQEARAVASEILAIAHDKATKLKAREIALANVEARKLLLRAREVAIDRVFDRIRERLGALPNDPQMYAQSLHVLAVEAIHAIDEPEVVFILDPQTETSMDAGFIDGLLADLHQTTGEAISVTHELKNIGPGCVATSTDGRVIMDNTYEKRLLRMKTSLRASIALQLDGRHD